MGCTSSSDGGGSSRPGDAETRDFKSVYRIGKVLGEGAFSVVKLATNKKTNQKFAVKCIDRNGLPADDEASLRQEVDILTQMDHDNIVRLVDFFEEEKFFYVVLEFLEGGELFDRIVKKSFYNEKEARDLVYIMLSAMKYCHDRNVVHRDLKPENLLLTSPDDDANVKIADFGFAIKANGPMSLATQCGTPGYVAPEILSTQPYGKAVDMWSIGVITYILLGGYPPFHDDNQKNLFKKIKRGDYQFHPEYWGSVSDEAKDLISNLLKTNPNERYTVDQCLNHSWLVRDAGELSGRNLNANLEQLRKYQATRKFRAAGKAIIAIKRMENILGSNSGALKEDEAQNAEAVDALNENAV